MKIRGRNHAALATTSFERLTEIKYWERLFAQVQSVLMLSKLVRNRLRSVARNVGYWFERRREEEIAISNAMAAQPVADLEFPSSYVRFLRDCMRPQRHDLKEVKTVQEPVSDAGARFNTLLDVLSRDVPAVPLADAQDIGRVADRLQGNTQPCTFFAWVADVGLHVVRASSFGYKGRLIACIVRFTRSSQCLELGTAYGFSGFFILSALGRNGERGRLSTLEAMEPQFSLASKMLSERYGESVSCYKGLTYEALPALLPTLGEIDFLYHDAGHSRKDYATDFELVEPALASGAVVLFDDINWNAPKFYGSDPQTYAGWMDVVRHERVVRAVEVDGMLGLLLLR